MTLSTHPEWKQRGIEDAKTFNLTYSVNEQGIEGWQNEGSDDKWRMWRGSTKYTVAHFDDKQFTQHEFFESRLDAFNKLVEKRVDKG